MAQVRVIIQCRTNSARLPGKAFLPLKILPTVVLCAKRAMNQGAQVVVATSTLPIDDNLITLLTQHQIPYIRGPLEDVLQRYVAASNDLALEDFVVRLTADNVFPDGKFIHELVQYTIDNDLSYVTTDFALNGFPYGLGAEIFRVSALREANARATTPFEREHVTPWLRNQFDKKTYLFKEQNNMSHLRCTLDTLEDYTSLYALFEKIEDPVHVSWQTLCKLLAAQTTQIKSDIKKRLPISEFTLGTAQIGLPYGITNHKGMLNEVEAEEILHTAIKKGIHTFDCARGYGCAESRLAKTISKESATIITKLAPFAQDDANQHLYAHYVKASIYQSCSELQKNTLDIVMLHRFWHYQSPIVWNALKVLKAEGVIKHLGVSVSTVHEARIALQESEFDYIQLPYNILDWRWNEPDLQALFKLHPEKCIFARSIYLQGLIASPLADWPEKFKEVGSAIFPILEKMVNTFNRQNIQDLCIAYVRSQPWINSIVVGCLDKHQLEANIELFNQPKLSTEECQYITNALPQYPETFLNPALW